MKAWERYRNGLTKSEVEFCEAYLTNGNSVIGAVNALGEWIGDPAKANAKGYYIMRKPLVKRYIKKRLSEVEDEAKITFSKKAEKLWHIANKCAPDEAKHHKQMNPKAATSAISELNKMQGHYAPESTIKRSDDDDEDIQEAAALLEKIISKNKQDY